MAIDFENTPIEWKNKGVEPDNTLKNNGYASEAVSYTHLDVYKRQILGRLTMEKIKKKTNIGR